MQRNITTVLQTKRRLLVLILTLITAAIATQDAMADNCAKGKWTHTEISLQKARARIQSDAHTNAQSRVNCGVTIQSELAASSIDRNCEACVREYANFLRDLIVYTRRAAESSASKVSTRKYYESEIRSRTSLSELILDQQDQSLLNNYWSSNFEGLGDAMMRIQSGKEFHLAAILAGKKELSPKSFDTWARAVGSCQTWDFANTVNKGFPALRKMLLCVGECTEALRALRKRVDEGSEIRKKDIQSALDALLPTIESCPGAANP